MSDILERAKKALIDDDMTYEDYNECISSLIAEVERKNEMMNIVENTSKYSTARLEEQIEALVIRAIKAERMVERLRSENRELKKTDVWANDVIKEHESLNARIKALEAWLVEERANLILEKIRGGGSIITLHGSAKRRVNAIRLLQAEGKIGGGKTEYGGQHHCGTQITRTGGGEWHCPKCNPLLTAEQRGSLDFTLEYLCDDPNDAADPDIPNAIKAIRSLLSGSVPAWEVTDERIAAMKDACNFLVYAEIRNKGVNPGNVDRAKNAGDVLRAMLEEAGQK